jgi:Predicted nucleic acid-binding protein, contains PIN domain
LSYLIDTNVISELTKPNPNAQVEQWFGERDAGLLFLSVLTLGELRKGIESLPIGTKRQRLAIGSMASLRDFSPVGSSQSMRRSLHAGRTYKARQAAPFQQSIVCSPRRP